MNKLFFKNISTLMSIAVLMFSGLFVVASQAFAEISGREISADLGAADLSAIISEWPYLLLIGLIIIILLCLVNVFYRIKEKNKNK